MDKLPKVDPEPEIPKETPNTEVAPPPQIEVIVNDEEDVVPHQDIFKEVTQQPVPKKKRKPTQAQLDNLAKMRVKRAENRAKAKKEAEVAQAQKIPANATPVPKQAPAIQEAPKMPNMNDGFVGFLDYMERYKSLKDNWKKREIEKAKKYVAKQETESVPQKKPEKQPAKKTPKKPPSLLTNHSTNNNMYSDYF